MVKKSKKGFFWIADMKQRNVERVKDRGRKIYIKKEGSRMNWRWRDDVKILVANT